MPAEVEVALIGGGIMSATIGTLLALLEPGWQIAVFERLDVVAQESSAAWNNAGTGHAAYCELNYTPVLDDIPGLDDIPDLDGTSSLGNSPLADTPYPDASQGPQSPPSKWRIDTTKAKTINKEFQTSLNLWSHLAAQNIIKPQEFISRVPHLTFVEGAEDVSFLRARYEALHSEAGFQHLEYSSDPEVIAKWAPLVVKGRSDSPIAATREVHGTDVNFGELSAQLFTALAGRGAQIYLETEVVALTKQNDRWCLQLYNRKTKQTSNVLARFVFVGAGGGTLPLLQKAKLPEIKGYAGFPISGRFLKCTNPEVIRQHHAKVYAKAALGAPPMSVPHLDTRIIDGRLQLVFGPYAGFTPAYLKYGQKLGLFRSLRWHNIIPMLSAGLANIGLTKYLIKEVFASKRKRIAALQQLFPTAQAQDWELTTAGQRVQIIKPIRKHGMGTLAFGTEIVTAADGSMAGLLGASPGASTAVAIAVETLNRCFPTKYLTWLPHLNDMLSEHTQPSTNLF
ncbi:MAG: malate:quinone oxidoreductase [Cellulomonadaceae bacterium]|jgi:malate dehydrogenase (quinone)|nr:malate:quinone oxidoreductase [Cellulomonadaceae bacterium]